MPVLCVCVCVRRSSYTYNRPILKRHLRTDKYRDFCYLARVPLAGLPVSCEGRVTIQKARLFRPRWKCGRREYRKLRCVQCSTDYLPYSLPSSPYLHRFQTAATIWLFPSDGRVFTRCGREIPSPGWQSRPSSFLQLHAICKFPRGLVKAKQESVPTDAVTNTTLDMLTHWC